MLYSAFSCERFLNAKLKKKVLTALKNEGNYTAQDMKEVSIMAIRKPFNLLKKGFIDPECKLNKAISEKMTAEEYIETCVKTAISTYLLSKRKNVEKRATLISNIDRAAINPSYPPSEIFNSGADAEIVNRSDFTTVINTGDNAKIMCKGERIINSGSNCIIGTLGVNEIVDAGDNTEIVSFGQGSIVCSGYKQRILSKGNCTNIICNGHLAAICSEGEAANVICNGYGCVVKAKLGSTITITENRETSDGRINYRRTATVDGVKIKADTWYGLRNNKFVETLPGEVKSVFPDIASPEYIERLETESELWDYADEHNTYSIDLHDESQSKYILVHEEDNEAVKVIPYSKDIGEVKIVFSSLETAKAAIEAIGEDRVNKYVSYYGPLEL